MDGVYHFELFRVARHITAEFEPAPYSQTEAELRISLCGDGISMRVFASNLKQGRIHDQNQSRTGGQGRKMPVFTLSNSIITDGRTNGRTDGQSLL